MLVLTRNTHESLYIGDEVKVTILTVSGNQVRIGIDAPNHLTILREELYAQDQSRHGLVGMSQTEQCT